MFYRIKVLFVATFIYIFDRDVSAGGAVEQAKAIVREVKDQCK
jgi:hypothetical protein